MNLEKLMLHLMINTSNVRTMEVKIQQLNITLKTLGHI